jgi:hypothetical protein
LNNDPFNIDEAELPIQPSPSSGIFFPNSNGLFVFPDRLKNRPTPRDPKLALNDPRQTYTDCRTIEGWMDVVGKLIKAAWSDKDGNCPVQFTHDYALIPSDPKKLVGVIIVWEILSMIPAKMGHHQEIKPRVREVAKTAPLASGSTSAGDTTYAVDSLVSGAKWYWAQSFDITVKFALYADSYTRKNEYMQKFLDLMLTYTGIYIQTGLQHCLFRGLMQEALYDPPRNEEFPNQSILYDVRIERQTPVNYSIIEEVLIKAGILSPVTGIIGDTLLGEVSGLPDSPILPGPN